MENLPKLTVSELTSILKTTLESSFFGLTVEGEISGFKPASTGHWYFSLKDEGALINCAVWRSSISKIGFVPKDGQKVIVKGNISVYEPRGSYQIICSSMRPSGDGDILAQLEERKKKYQALGWFDESLKKPIPKSPSRVAFITSPTGAALQDMLQVTQRRSTTMDIIILPATVQGDNAGISIAKRIEEVNKFLLAEVMIVGRGGGSLEDLLPFSEDCVIKAIHESEIPVISAVGHEVDFTLCDFVADLRAPTPSAAAELVCEATVDRKEKLVKQALVLQRVINNKVTEARLTYNTFSTERLQAVLENRFANKHIAFDSIVNSMEKNVTAILNREKSRLSTETARLTSLSPLSVLERGYSIVTDKDGKTIRDFSLQKQGSEVLIRSQKGSAKAEITEIIPEASNEI